MSKKIPLLLLALLVLTGAGCDFSFGDSVMSDDDDFMMEDTMNYDPDRDYEVPDGLAAKVNAPLRASVGEAFQVTVDVTNNSSEDQLIHSIDVDANYIDGIAVVSTDPLFTDSFPLDDGTVTHFFEQPIAVGETSTITFNVEAVKAGDYQGAFDVCFEDGLVCSFLQIRTIVE